MATQVDPRLGRLRSLLGFGDSGDGLDEPSALAAPEPQADPRVGRLRSLVEVGLEGVRLGEQLPETITPAASVSTAVPAFEPAKVGRDIELGRAAGALVESTVGVPGITRPALPSPESFIKPPEPEAPPQTALAPEERLTAPADVTAAVAPPPAPPPAPPTMRAAPIGAATAARVEEMQREAAEAEAERRRDLLRTIEPLPGTGDVMRLAGHAGYGMQKLAGGLPARGLHAAAEAITGEELRSPKEIMEAPETTTGERAAQLAGTLYGAGTLMAAQGRALGRLGTRLAAPEIAAEAPGVARAGRALRAFDPAVPVSRPVAAATSAIEGIPIDLAYESESGRERLTNLALGLGLGAGLGPIFRRTTEAVPRRTVRGRVDEPGEPPAMPPAPLGAVETPSVRPEAPRVPEPAVTPREPEIAAPAPTAAVAEPFASRPAGREEASFFPGSGERIQTRYRVVEADELTPSHDPFTFQPQPPERYPAEIQGRAYHGARGRAAQEQVVTQAQRYDPDLALDPTIDVGGGPPVVTPQGVAVAGNQRVMLAQRAAREHPERYADYRQALEERAAQFGIDPEQVRGMRELVLVREIADPAVDVTDIEMLRRLNAASDVPKGKTKDVLSDAATRAGALRTADRSLAHLTETLPPDATLRQYLETADGRGFLHELVQDGVITQTEAARYVDAATGSVTDEGKRLVERMLQVAAIGDADVVSRATSASLRKIEHGMPALVRASTVESWDIGPALRESLDIIASARAAGSVNVREFVGQGDLLGRAYDPQAVALAELIETGSKADVTAALRGYADDAAAYARQTQAEDLFGFEPPTAVQAAGRRLRGPLQQAALVPPEGRPPRDAREAAAQALARRVAPRDPMEGLRPLQRTQARRAEQRAFQARTQGELKGALAEDLRVQRIRESTAQPHDPRDTWNAFGGETPAPERAALRERTAGRLDQSTGYSDAAMKHDELLDDADRPGLTAEEIDAYFDGPIAQDRQAWVIIGPPAAGKSTLADPIVVQNRARLIDSDEVKKLLPEYDEGRGAGAVHRESAHIAEHLLDQAIERGENFVYPRVGGDLDEVAFAIRDLSENGYDVHLILNDLPALEAAKRAYRRFLDTGRYVDFDYILEEVGDRPAQAFQGLKRLPEVTSYRRYSNDVPRGQAPRLLEEGGNLEWVGRSRAVSGRAIPEVRREAPGASPATRGRGAPPEEARLDIPRGRGGEAPRALTPQRELFNAQQQVEQLEQGSLFAAPQPARGLSAAIEQARQTVSFLEGKVQRGTATADQVVAYQEARALLRRGEAMDAEDLARVRRETGAEQPRRRLAGPQASMFERRLAGPGGARPLSPRPMSEALPEAGPFRMGPEGEAPRPSDIQRGLAEALGVPVRVGKLGRGKLLRSALGIYKPRARVIRLARAGDITTLGHEMGHDLHAAMFGTVKGGLTDDQLALLPGTIPAELEQLGRGISDQSLAEGWAEFWRRYIDNPDVLPRQAPELLRYVEDRLDGLSGVRGALQKARDDWSVYREAGPEARLDAKISTKEEPRTATIDDALYRLRRDVIDDMTGLERVQEAILGGKAHLSLDEDAITLARLARGAADEAEVFLERGIIDFDTREISGKGLRQILEPVTDRIDQFRRYATARRVQELHERDIESGFRIDDANEIVRRYDADPEMRAAFDELQQYNDGLLRYLRDSGVLSDDTYALIRERNLNYVPFYRVLDNDHALGGGSRTFGHIFNPTKKIKGSGRDVVDPLESLIKNTYLYVQTARRQQVSNALAQLAEHQGAGRFIEQLPAPIKPVQLRLGQAESAMRKKLAEMIGDEAVQELERLPREVADEMLTVFQPGDYFRKENIISVVRDGKRAWYEVDPELYRALNALDAEQTSALTKLLSIPARTLRAGAILSPEFLGRNPFRDQLWAYITSESGYKPFVDLARGMSHYLGKDDTFWRWKASGGASSALTSMDRKAMRQTLQSLTDTPSARVANVIKNPIEGLRALGELMEYSTRLGEYARAERAMLEQGLDPREAQAYAGLASREIGTDYARHGAKTNAVRLITAFWNARLQGYDRLFRAYKEAPLEVTARAITGITLPSLLLYAVNRDDPEYWEIPLWQRNLFWLVKLPNGTWLRFPKPFEPGLVFGSVPERLLEWADTQDPEGRNEYAQRAGRQRRARAAAAGVPAVRRERDELLVLPRPADRAARA
ncbi:MAG: zeta toxin family protein [Longimicrobiales bacterium]